MTRVHAPRQVTFDEFSRVIRQDVRISRAQLEDAELQQIFALMGAGQPRAGGAALFVFSIANIRSMAFWYGRARRLTARFPAPGQMKMAPTRSTRRS